jgi:hypothetical protein
MAGPMNLANETINLEFVSANPTGPLHIGHTRWAALGDSLVRVLRAAGARVVSEFYINDAGRPNGCFWCIPSWLRPRARQLQKMATRVRTSRPGRGVMPRTPRSSGDARGRSSGLARDAGLCPAAWQEIKESLPGSMWTLMSGSQSVTLHAVDA